MDRIIGVLRVVAAPMVKKTVNLDFVQNMNVVPAECTLPRTESPNPASVEAFISDS